MWVNFTALTMAGHLEASLLNFLHIVIGGVLACTVAAFLLAHKVYQTRIAELKRKFIGATEQS